MNIQVLNEWINWQIHESDSEDTEIEKNLALVSVHEKGKRPLGYEKTSPTSEKKKVKRVKMSKEPPFHI